jgi:hypothetical protein
MKTGTVLALFVLFFIGYHSFGQTTRKTYLDSILIKGDALKKYYNAAAEPNGAIYQHQFFAIFPNSFTELCALYGCNHNTSAILYYDYRTHILGLFNNLSQIDDSVYYSRFIAIAVDAHWDAEVANCLQDGLRTRVLIDPILTTYILNSYPEEKIKNFWYFFFDGRPPVQKIPPELEKIKAIDAKMYGLMIGAHRAVVKRKEWR